MQGSGQPGMLAKSILLGDLSLPTGSLEGCKEEAPVRHHHPKHSLYLPQTCSEALPGAHGWCFAAGTVLLGKEAVHVKGQIQSNSSRDQSRTTSTHAPQMTPVLGSLLKNKS